MISELSLKEGFMVLPADRRRCGKIVTVENKLLCVATATFGAGTSSPWPIDAETRAVVVIAITIAIIIRLFRPVPIALAHITR